MLKIVGGAATDCSGVTRRNFLQAGVLGLGGLSLAELGRLQAATAAKHETSVILVLAQRRAGAHGDVGPQARCGRAVPRSLRRHTHARSRRPLR